MGERLEVRRAKREDLAAVAALVSEATQSRVQVDETDVMDWLFSKGLWVAFLEDSLVGVAAWQAENLVSVTDVFHLNLEQSWEEAGSQLLETVEAEASTLMCEANILAVAAWTPEVIRVFLQQLGYQPHELQDLHRIWREVLNEFVTKETNLMVKRLRERMVMVPI
jgi:N-acetylglutamate synthase-like GNAT family acetyltransferase